MENLKVQNMECSFKFLAIKFSPTFYFYKRRIFCIRSNRISYHYSPSCLDETSIAAINIVFLFIKIAVINNAINFMH